MPEIEIQPTITNRGTLASDAGKTTLAGAEKQAAEQGYARPENRTEGAELVDKVKAAPAGIGTEKPAQMAASSAAEATKTAGALLDEWFTAHIHNSTYSRDVTKFNAIRSAYRTLRAQIT